MSEKAGDPPPYEAGDGKGFQPGQPEQGYSGQGYSGQGYSGPGYPGQPYQGQAYPGQAAGYPAPQGVAPQYGYTTTNYTAMQTGAPVVQAAPPDHFCLAVFVTLCCFWPTGILAIMKASDARSSVARGDMVSAHSQARSAKQMINISIGVGIASIILVAVIVGVYVGIILNNVNYWD